MQIMAQYYQTDFSTLELIQPVKGVWHIKFNGEVIHQIKSMLAFYRTLGYPDIPTNIFEKKVNFAQDVVLLNEYIHADFHKKHTEGCSYCLKFKIAEYLIKNCDSFRMSYGEHLLSYFNNYKLENNINCNGLNYCKVFLN